MLCSLSNTVNESALQTIQKLEKDLGKTLLAFSCHNLNPSSLSDEELQKVQEVEKNLGVSLVAVDS